MNISNETRKEILKEAYKRGFGAFEHMSLSDIDAESVESESVTIMLHESNEYRKMFWDIEDHFGFERGKHDWDNFGIYGIIEDSSSCFEAGAYDALENKEYNPERISFMWG